MPLEASTAREKANIVNIVATRSGCSEVGPIVYLAKTSHPPKLRVRTSGQQNERAQMGGKSWSHKRAVRLRKLRRKQRTRKAQEKEGLRKEPPKKKRG
jgi:hypothetical protein